MRKILLSLFVVFISLTVNKVAAQSDSVPLFSTLRLEVRADLQYNHAVTDTSSSTMVQNRDNTYGFTGRYFNLHVGGNLTPKLSYYFRQRIIANPGSSSFFDNTDFLYLNYQITPNWSVRAGKDALAVGGFEYDAPPIDVLFWSYYWDNFHCFQLAASAKYTTDDGRNSIVAQVANSPYIFYSSPFKNSLFSYNLMWNGKFGPFQTLYSFNMFQRNKKGQFMNYVALGNMLTFKKWDIYVDFIHRTTSPRSLMKDFGVVCRMNINFNDSFVMFLKGAYEQNTDNDEMDNFLLTGESWDCLSHPGLIYTYGGLGLEYRPKRAPDVRVHAFVAGIYKQYTAEEKALNHPVNYTDITANVGVSWNIDILRYMNKYINKRTK